MKYFFTKTNLAILILTFVFGVIAFPIWVHHNRSHFPNSFVMRYSDFGPPSSSYELLGAEWYQWNSQGPDDPNGRDDVKVVIYRNIDLPTVKRTYPIFKGNLIIATANKGKPLVSSERGLRNWKQIRIEFQRTDELMRR